MQAFKFAAALLFSLAAAAPALAQTPTRIRGSIISLDGQILSVKERSGKEVKIKLNDNFGVALVVPITMADIKPNSFIGAASMKQADGSHKALEVLVFPEAMRGSNEGSYAWDLLPNSTMTNGNVEAVVNANSGRDLALSYKGGGKINVTVPAGTPIVTFQPGDKSNLTPGALVFVGAQAAADGSLSAGRVNVGKDGFKPPM